MDLYFVEDQDITTTPTFKEDYKGSYFTVAGKKVYMPSDIEFVDQPDVNIPENALLSGCDIKACEGGNYQLVAADGDDADQYAIVVAKFKNEIPLTTWQKFLNFWVNLFTGMPQYQPSKFASFSSLQAGGVEYIRDDYILGVNEFLIKIHPKSSIVVAYHSNTEGMKHYFFKLDGGNLIRTVCSDVAYH